MGREIVYCATCGTRILQEEFDQGKAITLNNKNYCPKCRKSVMPETAPPPAAEEADLRPVAVDRGKGSSALRRAVNVPQSATTPARGSPALGGGTSVRSSRRPRPWFRARRAPPRPEFLQSAHHRPRVRRRGGPRARSRGSQQEMTISTANFANLRE